MPSMLSRIRSSVQSVLEVPEDDLPLIDYVVCMVGANFLKDVHDILWGWIIGPSGSAKTEVIRLMQPWESCIEFLSSLTANALASGTVTSDGQDPSLLPKLNNRILVLKDAAPVYSSEERDIIKFLSEMRDAYDGFYGKASGTEGTRKYKVKFGFLACMTGVFDQFAEQQQQLGERMLVLRVSRKRRVLAKRVGHVSNVIEKSYTKGIWREDLATLFVESMEDYVRRLQETPPVGIIRPKPVLKRLSTLADLVVNLRTAPYRTGSTADAEIGSRLGIQLCHLGTARVIADERKEWDDTDIEFITRVAQDTLPRHLLRLIKACYNTTSSRAFTFEELMKLAKLPGDAIYHVAPQWLSLGLLEYAPQSITHVRLSEEAREQVRFTGFLDGWVP